MQNKKSILVVDDDEALVGALQTKFSDRGYAVTVAKDGTEAIGLIEEQVFSVILTDIHMPNANGFAVLDRLKMTRNAQTSVYVITNLGSDQYCEKALALGAKQCFIKSLMSLRDVVEIVDRATE